MNQGKYVFSQVMEFFPRWVFEKAVKKYAGDFHAKSLNSYSHCLHLMFGQMAGCKSLKDISLVLKSLKKSVYHLGIPTAVDSSSLSRANEVRDYRIFEELGMWLINKVRPMYAKENIPDVYLPGWEIFAIDSTTIPCSIKLAEWALGKYSKGGVKMHTVLDLRGSIPETIYVTDSRWHDSNFLDVYEPYKWAIYTMDKAYVDFEALYRMQLHKTYFITRAKDTMKYQQLGTWATRHSQHLSQPMANRNVFQIDQGKPDGQIVLGIFRECCQDPSLGCNQFIPVACLDKSSAQKPTYNHGSLQSC